ncbi:MAG: hypothetical protein QW759_01270, partial [Candidatus Micrarchaeaceae archaeon]
MPTIKYGGKKYFLHTYLSASEAASLHLSFSQRLNLLLFGYVSMPCISPPKGRQNEIFLVRTKEGTYFSYPQSHYEEFYAPE